MGYWQAQQGGMFMQGKSGETIFYPWGSLGSGYIIDTEERERSIRRILKYSTLTGMVLGYPSYNLAGGLGVIGLMLLISCIIFISLNYLLFGLKKSNEKFRFKFHNIDGILNHSSVKLASIFVFFFLFFIGSIFILVLTDRIFAGSIGVITAIFFLIPLTRALVVRILNLSIAPEPEVDDIRE